MSGSSSYNTFESEDESTGWLLTSETSVDDELSDELTLLNGDEDCDEDTLSFEALIKLSMRLKKQYNLREATVELERCDKIWDTMQLVKKMQMNYESEDTLTDDEDDEDGEEERKHTPSTATSCLPEGAFTSVPYIKYQPVQGNGNNALPNFYLAVKSQKKLYNCVTCGKQYSEKRSLALHSQKEHGVVIPKAMKKNQRSTDNKTASQDSAENKIVNNSSSGDRDNSKSRLSSTSKQSTDQQPHRKRESDTTTSPLLLPEPKKEAEASPATEETHAKTFICRICGSAYRYQRGMTKHIMNVHDKTLAEAEAEYGNGETTATKPLLKNYPPPKSQEVKRETSRINEETFADVDHGKPPNSKYKYRYIYTCKPCGRTFTRKADFRVHARVSHNITISNDRSPPRSRAEKTREHEYYKCELLKVSAAAPSRCSGRMDRDKGYYRTIVKDETQQPRTMRSGRQIGDSLNANRPRRACAMNTSYTECTKEEEEVLQRDFILTTVTGESTKPSSSQTTTCFLCKNVFVDIRKHLIDYHRINCPHMILPLTAKAAETEKDRDKSVVSGETLESSAKSSAKITQKQRRIQERNERLKELAKNPNIRVLFDNKYRSNKGGTMFQCVSCLHKFTRLPHLKSHQQKHIINGVLRKHSAPNQQFNKYGPKVPKGPAVVPVPLTDFADSLRSEHRGDASEENDAETTGRKRRIGSSDKRLSSSSEHRTKKRKIEKPKELVNRGSESTSDSIQYNNERESALVMSETDCGSNEEDKPANPRDTRDSSDRDSGIGISITIKKRNNSYEVVEKDSGDDDKSKDFEHSKDDNTCWDSSSDATPVNFVNDDQEARRREILNSLDYSAKENDVGSVKADYEEDNVFGKKSGEESCSSNEKEANFHWKEEEYYGEDACASLPGKVPSLKVMCRTVLRRDDFSYLSSNDTISHPCPVCCRFYPTERDVTVHMLEHKVTRTDFRATRVHAIPSSVPRRYRTRPV